MYFIDIKDRLHNNEVLAVLAHSQYQPSPEKLDRLAGEYLSDSNIFAFAWEEQSSILGVIVLRRLRSGAFEILSIATDPPYQGKGIGSKLVSSAGETLQCRTIFAETDGDAVGFYRNCGFHIESLGEKYPGTVRYRCTLDFL